MSLISVIIPCYNYGHLIEDTIRSVQEQTYKNIEIIVINDGSTDSTKIVVEGMAADDNRIRLFNFKNSGLGTSRNLGISKANGEYIQFLDADDLLEKKKFEKQLFYFQKNPSLDIVYGSVRYFTHDPYDPKDRLLTYWGSSDEWMPKLSGKGNTHLSRALKGNFSHLSSLLFKKSIVDQVGDFDNSISAVADYHFLLRCMMKDAYFFYQDIPETFSLVRWHPDNMSKDPTYMRAEEIKMRKMLIPFLEGNNEALFNNGNAIKGLSLQVHHSWKKVFLSGGPFDFLKKGLKRIGLEKVAQKIFYK